MSDVLNTSEGLAASRRRIGSGAALSLAILAYAAAAAAVRPALFLDMAAVYGWEALLIVPNLVFFGYLLLAIAQDPARPARQLGRNLRASRGLLAPVGLTVILFVLGTAAFTTLKINIPAIVPFYADPVLARLDAMVFGTDPWRLAHAIEPKPLEWGLAWLYGKFWLFYWFGAILVMAFWPDRRLRHRYFWSISLTFLVAGTALATVLASVGPIYYDDFYHSNRFAPLLDALYAGSAGDYIHLVREYLLQAYSSPKGAIAAGISAMPSMHVAIVSCNAWLLSSIDRRLGAAAWAFAAFVMFESVYLAWHYALDGIASLAVVSLIWWGVGLTLRPGRTGVPQ